MQAQLQTHGLLATTGTARSRRAIPNYYRWEQWIFLKMCERGLA